MRGIAGEGTSRSDGSFSGRLGMELDSASLAVAAVRRDQRQDLGGDRRGQERADLAGVVVRVHLHDVGAGQVEPAKPADQPEDVARGGAACLRSLDARREGGVDDVEVERQEDLAAVELVEDAPAEGLDARASMNPSSTPRRNAVPALWR